MHRHFLTFGKSVQQASIARKMSKTSCFLLSLCSEIELLSETKDLNKSTLFDHKNHKEFVVAILELIVDTVLLGSNSLSHSFLLFVW